MILESEYVAADARIREALSVVEKKEQPLCSTVFQLSLETVCGTTVTLGTFCAQCRVLATACSCKPRGL